MAIFGHFGHFFFYYFSFSLPRQTRRGRNCARRRRKVRCFQETKLTKDDRQGVLTSDPKTEARNSSTTSLVVWAFSQPEKVGELFLCILSDFEIFCLLQWRWVERRTDFMSSFPAELSRRGSCIRARWHSAGISAAGGRALKASLSPACKTSCSALSWSLGAVELSSWASEGVSGDVVVRSTLLHWKHTGTFLVC